MAVIQQAQCRTEPGACLSYENRVNFSDANVTVKRNYKVTITQLSKYWIKCNYILTTDSIGLTTDSVGLVSGPL